MRWQFLWRFYPLRKEEGLNRDEIIKLIEEEEYDEKIIGQDFKTFEGMLLNEYDKTDNFNLFNEKDGKYYNVFNQKEGLPLKVRFSKLEKSWLNGMIKEPVVQALLGQEIIDKLKTSLGDASKGCNGKVLYEFFFF